MMGVKTIGIAIIALAIAISIFLVDHKIQTVAAEVSSAPGGEQKAIEDKEDSLF